MLYDYYTCAYTYKLQGITQVFKLKTRTGILYFITLYLLYIIINTAHTIIIYYIQV